MRENRIIESHAQTLHAIATGLWCLRDELSMSLNAGNLQSHMELAYDQLLEKSKLTTLKVLSSCTEKRTYMSCRELSMY